MKLTWSHFMLLVLPLFVGCETEEAPEPVLINLEDPVLEITELTANNIKVKLDKVDHADSYQMNVYLIPNAEEVMLIGTYENEVDFQHNFCSDSVKIVVYASALEGSNFLPSSGELDFKAPPCEYELTSNQSIVAPYCSYAPPYTGFAVDITNVSYNLPYDVWIDPDHLVIELTSNIAQYDPASSGPYLQTNGSSYYVQPPAFSHLVCDQDPDTDIISIDLSVKYSETGEHIPGSPMQFEVAIN